MKVSAVVVAQVAVLVLIGQKKWMHTHTHSLLCHLELFSVGTHFMFVYVWWFSWFAITENKNKKNTSFFVYVLSKITSFKVNFQCDLLWMIICRQADLQFIAGVTRKRSKSNRSPAIYVTRLHTCPCILLYWAVFRAHPATHSRWLGVFWVTHWDSPAKNDQNNILFGFHQDGIATGAIGGGGSVTLTAAQ